MASTFNPLDHIQVATPCSVSWEEMEGDERVRFCNQCQLNVYHLSEMSQQEAETLVFEKEGRRCIRFYRRADGTVLLRDCSVGLKRLTKRTWKVAAVIIAFAFNFIAPFGLSSKAQAAVKKYFPTDPYPYEGPTMGDLTVPTFKFPPTPSPSPTLEPSVGPSPTPPSPIKNNSKSHSATDSLYCHQDTPLPKQ